MLRLRGARFLKLKCSFLGAKKRDQQRGEICFYFASGSELRARESIAVFWAQLVLDHMRTNQSRCLGRRDIECCQSIAVFLAQST